MKQGVILDNLDLSAHAFYIVGRQPPAQLASDQPVSEQFLLMEHPSLSRKHAVF